MAAWPGKCALLLPTLISLGCSAPAKDAPTGAPTSIPQAERQPTPEAARWLIQPGHSTGALTPASSEADLQKKYGAEAVQPERIELGEGETSPGTVLFPGDSLHRLEIVWHDTLTRSRPQRLILRGSASEWKVSPGISLGSSLKDLERLNGRPFTLAGFGWDYSGVITDWRGGALDSVLTGAKLYLDPGPVQYQSAEYSQVLGDRDYSSSLPPMQQLNPRVATIFVDFE
jgi:hypothetical protein